MILATSWPLSTPALVTATALATTALLVLARTALWPRRRRVLPSPLHTLAETKDKRMRLGSWLYPTDAFPGGRDVETPYGSMRVYEFGPQDGPKVLFVHGISTPCMTLSLLAQACVARGCRVMLFDLFGRGYSDGVGDLPHDARLYSSQILCALASSPLPWTGSQARLRLIGYSMGGSLAICFANAFPDLVASLVLMAPAGLIRPTDFGTLSRILFRSGLIPDRIVTALARRRLQAPIVASRLSPKAMAAAALAAAETTNLNKATPTDTKPWPRSTEQVPPLQERMLEYVRWMVVHHHGFVAAFMSCIRHAPLLDESESWRRLARRAPGSTAVLLAEADEIINADHYTSHGLALVGGPDRVVWRVLPGSHDFVMTHVESVMGVLDDFWDMKKLG
ncbi:hypothetical protein CDD82_129 [Ophiocordyceps australis]|uniref:Serine aminopeptidase S33 domain-containing protein n=1 Tax=Ophiocordyceps australis TaxID=1399860 RepID=A0A2C5YJS4_9HYPO|nr:hypothetical protein CDD82_129 [Ophiocordyceps australis]